MPLVVTEATPPQATATGTLTSGSPTVTGIANTSALLGAVGVSGTGIPLGALVQSIDSTTQITLNVPATANGAQTLTFGIEPISLADAKLHLRVDFFDDDTLIAEQITSARRLAEAIGKITFVNTIYNMIDDAFPFTTGAFNRQVRQFYGQFQSGQAAVYPGVIALNAGVITFPRAPLVSIQSVQYLDANGALQTMPSGNYILVPGAPGRMQPAWGVIWPVTLPVIGSVAIQFTAGYGATNASVPSTCKSAVKLLLGWLYRNRDMGMPPETLLQTAARLLGSENNSGGYG